MSGKFGQADFMERTDVTESAKSLMYICAKSVLHKLIATLKHCCHDISIYVVIYVYCGIGYLNVEKKFCLC